MEGINFIPNKKDDGAVSKIVLRVRTLLPGLASLDVFMDVAVCHLNGTPLDLEKLLNADAFDFVHDIDGITGHLDRDTGKLDGRFLPRCALPKDGNE